MMLLEENQLSIGQTVLNWIFSSLADWTKEKNVFQKNNNKKILLFFFHILNI